MGKQAEKQGEVQKPMGNSFNETYLQRIMAKGMLKVLKWQNDKKALHNVGYG